MSKFTASQVTQMGGVDSRSNPLNMPQNRSLRCRNWAPQEDGHLRLRYGYSTVTMSASTATPITSMERFNLLDGTAYVVYNQGTSLYRINVATGAVSALTVRGAAIAGSGRWSWANAGNRLYGFNGVDKKVLDSTGTLRDIGLPALTAADVAGVSVAIGAADSTGLPATAVGGTQPGYQFYAAIWNPTTGVVGNRIAIGLRVAPTVASDIGITGLPNMASRDSEWVLVIGRSRDGAEVPYVITDASLNWLYVPNGSTAATVTQSRIDETRELPTRNVQPQAFVQVFKMGDKLYGVLQNDSRVYSTESQANVESTGQYNYMGLAEQSWPLDNWELFPSGQHISCANEFSQNGFILTAEKSALMTELAGEVSWQGPWDVGCPSWDGFTTCAYGPFWVTGRKELATMGQSGPFSVSEEYERALLSRIGSQYLAQVRINPHVDLEKGIDRLVIDALDSSGNPFQVVHDFKIRDARSDSGQGYDSVYSGPLASPYYSKAVQDQNGVKILWAAASNGRFYLIGNGVSDVGLTFTADNIMLLNAGADRPGIEYIEWYGDANVVWSIAKKLSSGVSDFVVLGPTEQVPGNNDLNGHTDPCYRVHIGDAELRHIYVRAQLVSDPVKTLALNDPPHMPLETYGRIYLISPLMTPGIGH